jgi:DNA polymerase (family 10)
VTTLDELEQAAREHRLGGIPGIGDMSEESILKGIDSVRRTEERKKGV